MKWSLFVFIYIACLRRAGQRPETHPQTSDYTNRKGKRILQQCKILFPFCDPAGIQTQDLQNRNLTLYSAKLRSRWYLRNAFPQNPPAKIRINSESQARGQNKFQTWTPRPSFLFNFSPAKVRRCPWGRKETIAGKRRLPSSEKSAVAHCPAILSIASRQSSINHFGVEVAPQTPTLPAPSNHSRRSAAGVSTR